MYRPTIASLVAPATNRAQRPGGALAAALGCVLLVAVIGGGPSGSSVSLAHAPATSPGAAERDLVTGRSQFTLMQMNLCLSGFAGCYRKVSYPAGVQDAVGRIREAHPDAVTLNEVCERDVRRIARQAGYHPRFSAVRAAGQPLSCVRPSGRGSFGDAVLTKASIAHAAGDRFKAQGGIEWRRWLCVTTRRDVDVCTAHLATRSAGELKANDAQCAELTALLVRRAVLRTVVFGGDVNRRRPCAPPDAWICTDASAAQAPGLQSAYGLGAIRSPAEELLAMTHTDHDVLLIHAHVRGSATTSGPARRRVQRTVARARRSPGRP